MSKTRADKIYEFEDFRLDAAHLLLYRKGREITLAPKVVETLLALVERHGEVLSKDELMRVVWADSIVEEGNLSQNLYLLRKVLNRTATDVGDKPLIETLYRRGYRFNGDVSCIESGTAKGFLSESDKNQTSALKTSTNNHHSSVERRDNVPALTERRTNGQKFSENGDYPPQTFAPANAYQAYNGKSSARASSHPNDWSIAVLPFVNMSSEAENEYFCDGLAEELLNALAKIDDLKVAARTSAFSFKNKNVEAGEIGKTLNVKTVLEGSVRRSGNRLRITVQLINAADGYHLWSERYDREMRDIFDMQDEITLAVVGALKLKLFGEEKAAVLKRGTDSPEAYELYLRGLFYFYKRTAEDIRKAIELFRQAIEKDPNYALAYVGLTDCYLIITVYTGNGAREMLLPAKAAATRAAEIDNSSAEAHATLGHFYFRSLEWQAAEREIKRAIELKPNYAAAHFWYSEYFRALRRFDEALREIKRAQELDLLSPSFRVFVGLAYWNLGNLDAAVNEWQQIIETTPNFLLAHSFLAEAYLRRGRGEEAIAEARKAVDLSGRGSLFLCNLGYVYALAGKRAEALAVIEELKEKHHAGEAVGFHFAQVYTGLKDNNQAVSWLERDFEAGDTMLLTNVTNSYFYEHLGGDSRYQNLLRRIGIPADENAPGKTTNEPSQAQTTKPQPSSKQHNNKNCISLIL